MREKEKVKHTDGGSQGKSCYITPSPYHSKTAEQDVDSFKEVISTPKQIDWNKQNSKRHFLQFLNTNFREEDLHISLTYSKGNLSLTIKDAENPPSNKWGCIEW